MTALSEALALVVRDLATSRAVLPEVRDVRWSDDPGRDTAMLHSRDGSGQGVSVMASDTFPEQVASVADQVQEWAVEELCARGRPATWPECPDHPDAHPLTPLVRKRLAVWVCPKTGRLVSDIGGLSLPPAQNTEPIAPSL
jgi:hypothetical protein